MGDYCRSDCLWGLYAPKGGVAQRELQIALYFAPDSSIFTDYLVDVSDFFLLREGKGESEVLGGGGGDFDGRSKRRENLAGG